MARTIVHQNSWLWGELSPEAAGRMGSQLYENGAKNLKNTRILNTGAISERHGMEHVRSVAARVATAEVRIDSATVFEVQFEATKALIYNSAGTLVTTLTGAPWTAAQVSEMAWTSVGGYLEIVHKDFAPYTIKYDGSAWSNAAKVWDSGAGTSLLQPYWRFQAKSTGLTPSALTGSITLTTTASHFVSGHVGTRVRFLGREITITAVGGPTSATGTVVQRLPPTYRLTVADGNGFRVGDAVSGADTSAEGEIAAIAGNQLDILMTSGFEGFEDATGVMEVLVGPQTKSKITALSQTLIASAGALDWDEQMFSAVRGYPGFVYTHESRLGYCDHKTVTDTLLLSAPSAFSNFEVSKGESDEAIVVSLNDREAAHVRACLSHQNLLIFSDRAVYYAPGPITPASFDPKKIAPIGINGAYPVAIEEGAIFVATGGKKVYGVIATGETQRPWRLFPLNEHADHMMTAPTRLAVSVGETGATERYIYFVNGDGKLLAAHFITEPLSIGWMPWTTNGSVKDIALVGGVPRLVVSRVVNGSTVWRVEKLSEDRQMDASTTFNSPNAAGLTHLVGETVTVRQGLLMVGDHLVDASGNVPTVTQAGTGFEAGFHFAMEVEPMSPLPDPSRFTRFRAGFSRYKIVHAAVRVKDSSQYKVAGQLRPAHDAGQSMLSTPVLRDEVRRFAILGRAHDPTVLIERPAPTPLTIVSTATEISI